MRHMVLLGYSVVGVIIMASLTSCASVSKVHPPISDDTGALRLAEVMQLGTRQEIVALGDHYKHLLASGLNDSDLRDGCLGRGKVYCCGGFLEQAQGNEMWFYIPNDMRVEVGDIVEVRRGRQPTTNDPGAVNTAVRVRHNEISHGPCRWVPEQEGLQKRVLFCDWMEKEGWVERNGLWNTWLKPASSVGAK